MSYGLWSITVPRMGPDGAPMLQYCWANGSSWNCLKLGAPRVLLQPNWAPFCTAAMWSTSPDSSSVAVMLLLPSAETSRWDRNCCWSNSIILQTNTVRWILGKLKNKKTGPIWKMIAPLFPVNVKVQSGLCSILEWGCAGDNSCSRWCIFFSLFFYFFVPEQKFQWVLLTWAWMNRSYVLEQRNNTNNRQHLRGPSFLKLSALIAYAFWSHLLEKLTPVTLWPPGVWSLFSGRVI